MSDSDVTLQNAVDTWAYQVNPSRNYAEGKSLGIKTQASNNAYAFLHFNRPFDLGSTIVSAKLRLYTKGSWGTTPTITVKRADARWAASRITYDSGMPGVQGAAYTLSQSSAVDGHLWEVDVTGLMQTVSNGGVWYGFRVESNSTALKYFYSADGNPDYKPVLFVEWSDAPQAPTTLQPSGGQKVSTNKPVLQFDFTDDIGSTAMQALQVQVNATNVWTAPTFDSGTVTSSVPELDLTTTAYAGLANGSTTYWRVRVQDGAGLWSPWSDGALFGRTDKPTYTITAPANSPNNFVYEWTPPFIVSALSSGTQAAIRWIVVETADPTNELWDSGRISGTSTTVTMPKGYLVDGTDYTLKVRRWDTADRAKTANDPTYIEVTKAFTFAEDLTPASPTAAAATVQTPYPWVKVTWTRATAPDYYTVKRRIGSGSYKVLDTDIDPVDTLISGTSNQWTDRTAPPGKALSYVVQATAAGKTSTTTAGSTAAQAAFSAAGIWIDSDTPNVQVFIANTGASTWAMGEDSAVFTAKGSTASVLITQGVRGYEGHVEGRLIPLHSKTAREWRDNLLAVKGRPGTVVRLTVGQEAFNAVLYNISVAPTGIPVGQLPVSFDFLQQGRSPGYDVRL